MEHNTGFTNYKGLMQAYINKNISTLRFASNMRYTPPYLDQNANNNATHTHNSWQVNNIFQFCQVGQPWGEGANFELVSPTSPSNK